MIRGKLYCSFTAFFVLLSGYICHSQALQPEQTISVLAIGNGDYKYGLFGSDSNINFSAHRFLHVLANYSTCSILESSPTRFLTKSHIISAIKSFIDTVESRPGKKNVGIIYYCGHGMANLAGSMYFIPGDFEAKLIDTTMEFLTDHLLNIDTINHLIIDAQMNRPPCKSSYYILGDYCSDKAGSKLV